MTDFLTDGTHLYEVASRRAVQNAGCFWRSGGRYEEVIRYAIVRDVVSEETATLDDLNLAALSPVSLSLTA